MKAFMDKDFMLLNETAKRLYHDYAEEMPIFDFHNHLSAKEIYEDHSYENMTQAWLSGDHYKWRAMRAYGVCEAKITDKRTDPFEKFAAWADTVDHAPGNPLYHWTHLELQRYFGITAPLSLETAEEIWNNCNLKLQLPQYSVRNLLKKQNVEALCTTDDPCDDLESHKRLREEGFEIRVLPTFRPDMAVAVEKDTFITYIKRLQDTVGYAIEGITGLVKALAERLDYFMEAGCLVSDHSLEGRFFSRASREEADTIFRRKLAGGVLTQEECAKYKGFLLKQLGREYHIRNMVMQLHIGALRNNSGRLFKILGADAGTDGMDDFPFAGLLASLLDEMEESGTLPKTILYCLNPHDTEMLACMAGSFQDGSIKGKIQLGAAWWFNDHKTGMEKQLDCLGSLGILSGFVGMLTDSRSFLSFPRHEYFRRILCNKLGTLIENGEYPPNIAKTGAIVRDICCRNAEAYFGI